MYSACDGSVDLSHAVGREEHDSLIVLQGSQEHTDEGISVDIADCTLLKENIRLIQKEERIPLRRPLKDKRKSFFKFCSGSA